MFAGHAASHFKSCAENFPDRFIGLFLQGGVDYFVWGKPFLELEEYIRYNAENATAYITNSWYNYILLILGTLIPPLSINSECGNLLLKYFNVSIVYDTPLRLNSISDT